MATIIVQARVGSTRLPGKVLMPLAGKPVLCHVLERCALIPGSHTVVCAIPDTDENDCLIPLIEGCGAIVARGPERDVLHRYTLAVRQVDAQTIMRVTADCPLIDPKVCGAVLDLHAEKGTDYCANNLKSTWPHGYDCEVFTRNTLELINFYEKDPYCREHVTVTMRELKGNRIANLANPLPELRKWRLTLDYEEDYYFLSAIFDHCQHFKTNEIINMTDLFILFAVHPEILKINAVRGLHK